LQASLALIHHMQRRNLAIPSSEKKPEGNLLEKLNVKEEICSLLIPFVSFWMFNKEFCEISGRWSLYSSSLSLDSLWGRIVFRKCGMHKELYGRFFP
jgi:hypothetical protein